MPSRDPTTRRIAAEARAFAVRRSSGEAGPEDEGALEAWLAEDPRHGAAWAEVSGLWERLGPLAGQLPRPAPRRRAPALRWAAGAAAVALTAALAWVVAGSHDMRLRTERERRSVPLADGSTLELDAASEVSVELRPWRRSARVVAGRAHFQVAHERRPFVATAGGATIEDLGTGFAVALDGPGVQVSVTEGRVRVLAAGQARELVEGQEVALVAGLLSEVQVSARDPASWRQGLATFDRTPLAEAVRAFAPYHGLRAVVVEGRAASLRVSGRFHTADLAGFLGSLEETYRLRAVVEGATVRLTPAP
ncbi:MAG: FecR domain-containing protein [Anaeromyxobacter sp.]|nr:FecR domain-containing protein [Anaeromyxobacter sp.]MBL0274863.1 FecR domain-containing protein [Anaeromyxobacter sp.]